MIKGCYRSIKEAIAGKYHPVLSFRILYRQRKRLLASFMIFLTLFIGTGIYLFVPGPWKSNVEAVWMDDNWAYRKAITVTVTTSASDITNLETLLTVDTDDFITASKLQSACQDLRFTNTNGKQLPYYIDSGCNGNSTKVWVMADLVPKNTTTYTMYMYYGNPSAAAGTDSQKFALFRDLEGYWTLNDTSGNRTDSSVNEQTLTDNNTVTSATGQYSNAGQFTAANSEYLSVSDNATLSTGDIDFTLATWVYLDSKPARQDFIAKWDNTNSRFEYLLTRGANGDFFEFYVRNPANNSNGTISTSADGAPSTGTWYFVVAWHDSTNNTINITVNNGTVRSTSWTQGVNDADAAFTLGGNSGGALHFHNGRLDDTRFYKRVLTADERSKLYSNPGTIATTAVGTITPSTSFATEEKAPSPVAYWKFDEGTGTTAQDSTTNNNDGTLTNGPTWQTEDQCIAGKCLYFDGSDDYVTTGSNVALANSSFTLSSWARRNTSGTWDVIMGKAATDTTNISLYFGFRNSDTFTCAFFGNDLNTTATYTDSSWHHWACTFDSSSKARKIFRDGVQVASDTASANYQGTGNLDIGRHPIVPTLNFQGFIDEPKIYGYARSAAQIQADFVARSNNEGASAVMGASNNQPAALSNGLVGYWKMDESSWNGTSGEVLDSSGNGFNGTRVGNATTAAGKYGNGGTLDDNGDYVAVTDPGSSSLDLTTQLTLSTWVYPTSVTNEGLIFKGPLSGQGLYSLIVYSGTVFFRLNGSVSDGSGQVTGGTIPLNTWSHITATYDQVNQRIYVNGLLVATQPYATAVSTDNNDLNLGVYFTSGFPFGGKMDEVRVYNRALSAADISTLYNFAPGPVGYWDFENGSGSSITDKSGSGQTGTWNGTLGSQWKPGKYGTGGNFNITDNTVTTASNSTLNVTQFTVGGWAYRKSTSTSYAGIIRGGTGGGAPGNYLSIRHTGEIVGRTTDSGGGTLCNVGVVNSSYINSWHHYMMSYDFATLKLYVDGVLVNSASCTSTPHTSSTGVTIGSASGANWDGLLDEIKIYNYARTQGQIIQDMNAGHPAPGSPVGTPLGYWKFDEGVDNTCSGGTNDACNYGNQGSTLDGAQSGMAVPATSTSGWTQSGKFGKALNFDGSNDYINVGTSSTAQITGDLTISGWFNATSLSGTRVLIMNGSSGEAAANNYLYSFVTTSATNFNYFHESGSGTDTNINITGNTISTSTWHHVVLVRDATAKTIKVFLDGTQYGSTQTYTTNSDTGTSNTTYIGADSGSSGFFSGSLDELKLYSLPLTADQVKLDYNRGASEVLGALGDNSSYQKQAGNQEYCIPGDSTSCAAPVGRWDFEEGGTTGPKDTSGNANNGTWNGTGTPRFKPGKLGKAGNFNGTDDYVDVGSGSSLNTASAVSVSAWVNPLTTGSRNFGILEKTVGGTINTQFLLFIESGSAKFRVAKSSTTYTATSNTTLSATAGTWTQLEGTYDGTTVKLYVNGILQTTTATIAGPLDSGSGTTLIGILGSSTYKFNGQIDQVRVFNYARTAAQVAWDYNKGAPVGYWRMDDCQGDKVVDSSGNSNTGTITVGASGTYTSVGTCAASSASSMWYNGVSGKRNYSLAFDGTDDFVDTNNSSLLDNLSQVTISSWVKVNTFATQKAIVSNYSGAGGSDRGVLLETGTGTNNVLVAINDGTNPFCQTSNNIYTTGSWNLWTMVFDGTQSSSNRLRFYLNGIQQTMTCTLPATTGDSSVSLKIGGTTDGATSRYLAGQIDDVRIYNYPLTAGQVKLLYNGGALNFAPVTGAP